MRPSPSRAVLLAGLAALAACASDAGAAFDTRLSTYIGQPEVRLVEGFGVPQRVYQGEGQRFLEYDLSSAASAPSTGLSFGIGAGSFGYGRGGGFGSGVGLGIPLGGGGYDAGPCIVTFETRDDRVLNFRRQGDNCR